jgi:hypothetical protein
LLGVVAERCVSVGAEAPNVDNTGAEELGCVKIGCETVDEVSTESRGVSKLDRVVGDDSKENEGNEGAVGEEPPCCPW